MAEPTADYELDGLDAVRERIENSAPARDGARRLEEAVREAMTPKAASPRPKALTISMSIKRVVQTDDDGTYEVSVGGEFECDPAHLVADNYDIVHRLLSGRLDAYLARAQ